MERWTEGEIKSFIKVWILAYLSLCYCFFAAKVLHKGIVRLAAFIPVIFLFLILPLGLQTVYLCGITAFFLTWLANFKLLMFAFDNGPLSNTNNFTISLPQFLALACLPIKIQQQNSCGTKKPKSYYLNHSFFLVLNIYDYKQNTHPVIFICLHCCHIYLTLEIMLGIIASLARILLGAELEPQFNRPHLSTSVHNFWGRRWNLAGTRILRPSVYVPVRKWWTVVIGRKWAMMPAVMSTFLVSGLVHELIYYYLGRVKPTWEVTCFFLLNGACVAVEIAVKREMNGRWRFPRLVSTVLSLGFVMSSSFWLFFPQLFRCKVPERAMAERAAVGEFTKDVLRTLTSTVNATVINGFAPFFK